jgi:hypothetical protein
MAAFKGSGYDTIIENLRPGFLSSRLINGYNIREGNTV